MDYAEIKPKFLKEKLVEKHTNFLSDYKKKLKDIKRLGVLEEKIDQLAHWIDNIEGDKTPDLISEKYSAEDELSKIGDFLGSLSHKNTAEITQKISEHEIALEYWEKK